MQIHDPDDDVAPPPAEKGPTEFTATFSEEYNAELSNFETKKIFSQAKVKGACF